MDAQKLHISLNQISLITDEAWEEFEQLLEPVSLDRNDHLIRVGERTHFCYLLTEGVIRVYYSKEGNEYNKTFFVPGMFPTALTSLLTESPCQLSFQALLPCQLIKFSYHRFRNLFASHRCLETFLLRVLEGEWVKKEKHDIQMVTNDAITNYMIFREAYPGLENKIPQHHIASYLGITPIHLSRIRAQLTKKP
ncbi:MAG: Crp/Fnr family transcriptional regulator [Bacteroidetes bacterium]|nr:Crp/Fnr family transcriptional regulator [Bacteroidota bacterium]MCB9343417.1 Crp/Fnr family transcriptional regulator [Lewinellaceae bacterium]